MEEWTVWDNQPNSETAICKDVLVYKDNQFAIIIRNYSKKVRYVFVHNLYNNIFLYLKLQLIVNGVTGLGGICVLELVEGVCKEEPVIQLPLKGMVERDVMVNRWKCKIAIHSHARVSNKLYHSLYLCLLLFFITTLCKYANHVYIKILLAVCKDSPRYESVCPTWTAYCVNSEFVQGCCKKSCHLC